MRPKENNPSVITNHILFLRGFLEGEPTSTTLHAGGLIKALHKYSAAEIECAEFAPKTLPYSWLKGAWGMRFARYFLYPFMTPQSTAAITHLLDYSYAHLLYFRNPVNTIVTVTDLMPVLWWKGLLPVNTKKDIPVTVLVSLHALKRASHIIAISCNTKRDLINLIGCDPSKISVVYFGVDEIFRPYDAPLKTSLREHFFGPGQKKIILITGSQFYKNHETALKTVAFLLANGSKNIYLVKTGNPTQDWVKLSKKYGLESNIINIGFIPREQMPDLYNSVDILLFPSLYEGFGWPPLEAMACGTPVLTSNAGSLPEVIESQDMMCDPFDFQGFARKIDMILGNEEFRQNLIQRGIAQASKFRWEVTAKQTVEVYKLVSDQTRIRENVRLHKRGNGS